MRRNPLTAIERRAIGTLAGIFSLRMFGLFLIMPVFALYAKGELAGTTPLLIGVALGAYGLTQAVFQIPYGMLSDRIGRKPMIAIGLLIFAAGSVVAALAESIHGVILGRALQGTGAIAAVVIALAADLTREDQRTKAMALIGVTIGATFLLSLILGPVFNTWIGVDGIFWLTAVLALAGIGVLYLWVPTPVAMAHDRRIKPVPRQFAEILRDLTLLRLDFGIFMLHLVLTALFVVAPIVLVEQAGVAAERLWTVYLPVIVLAVVGMVPLVLLSSRRGMVRGVFAFSVALLLAAQGVLYAADGRLPWLFAGLWVFFVGFNVLEALLPSLISRLAPAQSKGTAIGVYNSFEFFGAFLGGVLGGAVYGAYGLEGVFVLCAGLLAIWFLVALLTPAFTLLDSHTLKIGVQAEDEARALAARLSDLPGVAEAIVIAEEGVAYLKVDRKIVDMAQLDEVAMAASQRAAV